MRACRLFVNALKEDFGPYLTVDFFIPNEFPLDELYELKTKLNTLSNANNTYEKLWQNEATRLDKRIASSQETKEIATVAFGSWFIFMFLFYFTTTNKSSIAFIATIQCLCAIIVITFWFITYDAVYQRKLLESIK